MRKISPIMVGIATATLMAGTVAPAVAADEQSGVRTTGCAVNWYAESVMDTSLPDYSNAGYNFKILHPAPGENPTVGAFEVQHWRTGNTVFWRIPMGTVDPLNNAKLNIDLDPAYNYTVSANRYDYLNDPRSVYAGDFANNIAVTPDMINVTVDPATNTANHAEINFGNLAASTSTPGIIIVGTIPANAPADVVPVLGATLTADGVQGTGTCPVDVAPLTPAIEAQSTTANTLHLTAVGVNGLTAEWNLLNRAGEVVASGTFTGNLDESVTVPAGDDYQLQVRYPDTTLASDHSVYSTNWITVAAPPAALSPVMVSGKMYEDKDTSGTLTLGDIVVPNTTIVIVDENGNVINDSAGNPVSTTTDANGKYSLDYTPVDGSSYTVAVDPTSVESLNQDYTFVSNASASLQSGVNQQTQDFILKVKPANAITLNGTVYIDNNQDGVLSADETPIAGATINLINEQGEIVVDQNGNPITTQTDINGHYSFSFTPTDGVNYRVALNGADINTLTENGYQILGETVFDVSTDTPDQVNDFRIMESGVPVENTPTDTPVDNPVENTPILENGNSGNGVSTIQVPPTRDQNIVLGTPTTGEAVFIPSKSTITAPDTTPVVSGETTVVPVSETTPNNGEINLNEFMTGKKLAKTGFEAGQVAIAALGMSLAGGLVAAYASRKRKNA